MPKKTRVKQSSFLLCILTEKHEIIVMEKPRIKDIALKAGVSVGTVDRVLHNRGEVKEETKNEILKIAKELNYKPNVAAQLLKAPTLYKIAILIPEPVKENSFWTIHPKGFEKAAKNADLYQVEITFLKFSIKDEHDFEEKAQEIIELKPNGVIMAPLFKRETINFCDNLRQCNIPYVFIDTNIPEANCLAFVGEDAFKSGRVAAGLIDIITPTDKDILIVNIAKNLGNTQHLNSRNQGFMSYFVDKGNNQGLKISIDIPEEKPKEVKSYLDKVFRNNSNIGAILVSGSRTYAVAEYVEASRINTITVGYEAIEDNLKYLRNGVIQFLVSQRPLEQSKKSFDILLSYITSHIKPDENNYHQQIDILSAENID